MSTERPVRVLLVGGAAALLAAGVVAGLVRWSGQPPEGPVPVPWDHAACSECGMLVSEPAFAAQLHTRDNRIHFFDDPGCLLRYEAREALPVHARWFHHSREDRWLPGDAVSFAEVTPTPMGWGLGAVDAGEPRALSLDEARDRVRSLDRGRGEARR